MRHPATESLGRLRDELFRTAVACDSSRAIDLVLRALEAAGGCDGDILAGRAAAETILLNVIAPVQARVGTEWAANRITVAQEHGASAISDRCISALIGEVRRRPHERSRGRIIVACVEGEWHALPARLVAETLILRGWEVDYLGAQVPTPHLVAHIQQRNADAVLLSSSIPTRLPAAHAAISACQSVGMPVLVGGAAFGADGRYARLLGAEGWAADAPAAADALADGLTPRTEAPGLLGLDTLPHLSDQEYTFVITNKQVLARQVIADLERDFPAMRAYTDAQRERTAEDIDHIVEFLSVALYVDDHDLFTVFIGWTREILAARRVPAASMIPALDSLARQLHDFPRALGLLAAGRSALAAPPAPR
ncbi:B12-binding domain-containing protein [Streptomyces sp. NPDC101181]|uniref:cobalamin B12-binding domain-containing protein n=1 Tax=Streptomyces sp. NPDC101181 TaxID=3366125 RepID=UPI0037FD94F7